jgi:hypothetical protein
MHTLDYRNFLMVRFEVCYVLLVTWDYIPVYIVKI